jgi:hypothetical protein
MPKKCQVRKENGNPCRAEHNRERLCALRLRSARPREPFYFSQVSFRHRSNPRHLPFLIVERYGWHPSLPAQEGYQEVLGLPPLPSEK